MNVIFIILGYIGSGFLSLSYVPQVIKAYKTDDNSSISIKFIILQLITTILFITYSIGFFFDKSMDGMPIFVANIWVLICLILLLIRNLHLKYKK